MPPCPSAMTVCIPMGMARISSAMPATSAAAHASSVVSHGAATVMFENISPKKSLPFCMTQPILLLSDLRSSVFRSRRS